ncbi:Protein STRICTOSIDINE SYNTHASE-LIKE 10 [Camellia lanceoleosa]|uniref:Protein STRICTOSIDINE SYNTHASE-LIKE 10 n=1 Tax=Camellia lanceoleosa TaxID=1840588 RepID=A0ACC0FCP4_9ERIC|nr:Protein STRICTOSIDINE SYNTHASE-LIKE 10 [Camellia lanceoleosa]
MGLIRPEKLFVLNLDDETLGESRVVEDCVVSRPFVTNPDEETLEITMEEEEEEEKEYVDEPLRKQGVPIAMLSRDSGDDSVGSEEEEDDGVLGSVRVPSTCISEKTEVEGGEDESQFEPVMGLSEWCIALKDSVLSTNTVFTATGLESLAFALKGEEPYTGVANGRILKTKELCNGTNDHNLESICGRPLGLGFNDLTGELYIADPYFGLLVVGAGGGLATQLANGVEGMPFAFLDALDVDLVSKIVYFTDVGVVF